MRLFGCCTSSLPFIYHPAKHTCAQPLLGELGTIYSLSSLLFPCQDSLQYFQLLPALLCFIGFFFFFFKWCLNSFNFTKIQTTVLYMFCISAYIWVDGKICFKRREWWFLFSQYSPSSSFVNAASKHLSTLSHISQSAKLTFWYSRKDCSSLLSFVAFPRCWPCWWVPSFRWVFST